MAWFRTLALAAVAVGGAHRRRSGAGHLQPRQRRRPRDARSAQDLDRLRGATSCATSTTASSSTTPRRRSCPASAEKHEVSRRRPRLPLHAPRATRNGRTATPSRPPTSSSPSAASWTRRPARNTPTSSIRSSTPRRSTRARRAKLEELGVKAVDDRTLEITLERPTALLPRAPDAPDRHAGAPGLGPEARHELRQAREHGLERRLRAEGVGAELAHPAREEPAFPRRRERQDRRRALRADAGPVRGGARASRPASSTRRATSRPTRPSS